MINPSNVCVFDLYFFMKLSRQGRLGKTRAEGNETKYLINLRGKLGKFFLSLDARALAQPESERWTHESRCALQLMPKTRRMSAYTAAYQNAKQLPCFTPHGSSWTQLSLALI
jgi:hypothetical protein